MTGSSHTPRGGIKRKPVTRSAPRRGKPATELPGGGGTLQILSDDGGVVTNGTACKDRPMTAQEFRSIKLHP